MAAKQFLEGAKVSSSEIEAQRLLRASLTHNFFFLEAQLNYLASHFSESPDFSIVERSLLNEQDIAMKKGVFVLTNKPKFFSVEDRVEFLLARFSPDLNAAKGGWFSQLSSSIKVRNRLVHPKQEHTLTVKEVEVAIIAVLDCLSAMYIAIFGKGFPPHALGLHMGPTR